MKKILRGNKILTIIKGHYFVVNLRKLRGNNPNLELVKFNACTKFHQIPLILHKILSRNEILTITRDTTVLYSYNCVVTHNKLNNLDLVNINASAKFGPIPSICSQDIEWKRKPYDNQ